jgi:hypothetical protein
VVTRSRLGVVWNGEVGQGQGGGVARQGGQGMVRFGEAGQGGQGGGEARFGEARHGGHV